MKKIKDSTREIVNVVAEIGTFSIVSKLKKFQQI